MFIGNEAEQGQIKTQLGARMYSSTKWFKKKHQKGGGIWQVGWFEEDKFGEGRGGLQSAGKKNGRIWLLKLQILPTVELQREIR